jgi:dTDP-glucose pyrophosphorylase
MNIVIPMAGKGSRFQTAGYSFPKPLIDVNNKPMIQVVVENINLFGDDYKYTFIVLDEHYEQYSLKYLLPLITRNNCNIVRVKDTTQGAACTVLLAEEFINNDEELLLANSDQWVQWDSYNFIQYMNTKKADAGIVTFFATHPKWSFVRIDELSNKILEVAEKKPISNIATVGIYYSRQGKDFVNYAKQMIQKDIRTNNEFYVAPVFNEFIQDNKAVLSYPVAEMKGLGTPEDLERFLKYTDTTNIAERNAIFRKRVGIDAVRNLVEKNRELRIENQADE